MPLWCDREGVMEYRQTLFVLGNAAEQYVKRFELAYSEPLYATRIHVLPENILTGSDEVFLAELENIEPKRWKRRVLMVESFPVGTKMIANLLENLSRKVPEMSVQVLFIENGRRFAYSDVEDKSSSFEKAWAKYEEIFPGCIAKNKLNAHIISRYSMTNCFLSSFTKRILYLKRFLDQFDDPLNFFYDSSIFDAREDVTDPIRQDTFFCGYKVIGNERYIGGAYIENFIKYIENQTHLFYTGISQFYRNNMNPICMWDMEEDIASLHESIKKAFREASQYFQYDKTKKPKSELEYLKMNSKIQVDFKQFIGERGDFWKNILPMTIKKRMEEHYMMLANLYNKNNKNTTMFYKELSNE
jgi:hypothetical protein